MATQEKQQQLQIVLKELEKKYGKGIVMKLSDKQITNIPTISTGSLSLDVALGGGLPCGRVVEIYGPESSGKTTLALHAIAEVQKKGGVAALIDSEHAFDIVYAKALGVNTSELLITQPDDGEQALEVADQLIRSGGIGLVVIDSVAALVPKSELTGEMGENKVGAQARLMSQAMRKLTGNIHKTGSICIFINQLRHKIGVLFGNAETTPGGNALRYYASVRLRIRKEKQIKLEDQAIGHCIQVRVDKNKIAPPFKTAIFDLIYAKGISKTREIIDLATKLNILQLSGSWFAYNNKKLGQGKAALETYLESNPSLQQTLIEKIKSQL